MKPSKTFTITVLTFGLMVLSSSVAEGAQYLTVNNQDINSITLNLGQSCTIEINSDDDSSYVAYVGFDNGLVRGTFSHLITEPNAGNIAAVSEHNEPDFYGYEVLADAVYPDHPVPGVHFILEYTAQKVGETDLNLYEDSPPPLAGPLRDYVRITVIPEPMGTAFTYQGQLLDKNKPADGLYDFQFKVFEHFDPNLGSQQGSTIDINDLDVIDGHVIVELDFGSNVFSGDARWLEISVRPGSSNDPNAFVTLSPRQELTPVPYTTYAKTAGAVQAVGGGGIVPRGGIIMWSGSINDIPNNWALCDGTNNTPDLTSRFIRSVPNSSTDPGSTGGSLTHSHAPGSYSASSHTHPFSGTTGGPSNQTQRGHDPVPCAHENHTHTISGTTSGGGGGTISGTSGESSSLPLYYELAFIMKL
ncbi:MAG: hypothetical protein ACYS0I_14940 [Planctomycetota bacterium]|jgi:hypothetical protein